MIRHTVSALRWRDFARALLGLAWAKLRGQAPQAGAQALRQALAQPLGQPAQALWLTGAGRSALHAFIRSTRRSAEDEALLPGYTCVVVPNVFLHLGLAVRYVDVAPGRVNPCLESWAQAITPRTRWLVVPHNFGVPTEGLAELRQRFPQLCIIEDAAHAWGARFADGSPVGTQGHAAFFSFEYSKCLSTGLGGALLVNDAALRPGVAQALAQQHAPSAKTQLKVLLTLAYHLSQATWPRALAAALTQLMRAPSRALGLVAATRPAELSGQAQPDYQQALPELLARLALPQLARMPELLALRQQQAQRYAQALAGSPWLSALWQEPAATLLRAPVAVAQPEQRERLRAGLLALGIEPGVWFDDVVHPAGSYRHAYVEGACPQGERLARSIVNLPLGLHAQLTPQQWQGLRELALAP